MSHTSVTSGGFNIYGTAGDSMGSSVGRNESVIRHGFPRKFFPEHGVIITVMTARFPDLCINENPWLASKATPTYEEIACDPTVLGDMKPESVNIADFFNSASAAGSGYMPAGEQFRWHSPCISRYYEDKDNVSKGWPIRSQAPSSLEEAALCHREDGADSNFSNSDYFLGQQLLDWNMTARIDCMGFRNIPDGTKSIYAGADLNQG